MHYMSCIALNCVRLKYHNFDEKDIKKYQSISSNSPCLPVVWVYINSAILSCNALNHGVELRRCDNMSPGRQKFFDFLRHGFLRLQPHRDQLMMNPPRVNGRLDVFLQPEVADDHLVLEHSFSIQHTSLWSCQETITNFFQVALTWATAVVILVPPAAPSTMLASPFSSTMMVGHIDDSGRFPGLMKFSLDGSTP